jgi:hypothetical protein
MLRWLAALTIAGAVGIGCSKPHDAQRAPDVASSIANSSSSSGPPAPVDPRQAMKAAATQFAIDELGETRGATRGTDQVFLPDENDQSYLDVIDCDEGMRQTDLSGRKETFAESVYKRTAVLRQKMKLGGYPLEAFDPILAAYEEQRIAQGQPASSGDQLAAADREFEGQRALASQLEAARRQHSPDLPPIRAEGGCGGGESLAAFRSQPAGARIWLIPKFAFDVCRFSGLDSWNTTACDRWTELEPGVGSPLSGTYMYKAQWPDGSAARGSRSVRSAAEGVQTFVVARQ